MTGHLNDDTLGALHDRALAPAEAAEAERHLAGCEDCRARLAALSAQDESLSRALEHDPGDAYFESFEARVQQRIAATAAKAAPAPRRPLFAPRAMAWAGSAIALAAVAALAIVLSRGHGPSELASRAAPKTEVGAREAAPQAEGAQAPPAAASPAREREALRADQSVLKQRAEKKLGAAAPEPEASNQAAPEPEASKQAAPPAHVMQVKTLPNGEQVPVGPATPIPFARPPLEAKGGFKKPAAQPLGAGAEEQREVAATSGAALDASRDRMAATSPAAPAPELEKSEASAGAALTTRLCGEVRDDRGRPIAGAAITLTGTGAGATSDAEGGFCVGAPATPATLQVLAVGYRSFRRSLAAADLARPVAVTLRSAEALPSAGYLAGTRAEPPRDPAAWAAALEATRAAARDSSATLWGRAAERWAAAAASAGGPQGADEARFHVAEARVRAWRLGRTEPQRRAAIDAVEAYLAAGGTDPLHELGQRWRRELSP